MRIEIEVGLEDILEEVTDYESGNTYYQYKDENELKKEVKEQIKDVVVREICYGKYTAIANSIDKFINDYKDEIVNKIVDRVSKKIINQKAVKDFKKTLED